MIGGRGEAGTKGPARSLLIGAAAPAVVLGVLVSLAFLIVSPSAATSSLIGCALAVLGLSAGPALLAISRTLSPPAVMATALGGYAITVIVLGAAYVLLGEIGGLSGTHVGLGILVTVVAGLAGQLRAASKLRILAFGSAPHAAKRPSDVVHPGSPASPEKPGG